MFWWDGPWRVAQCRRMCGCKTQKQQFAGSARPAALQHEQFVHGSMRGCVQAALMPSPGCVCVLMLRGIGDACRLKPTECMAHAVAWRELHECVRQHRVLPLEVC